MTLHFFSPHQQYAHGEALEEFRAMVRAFHAAGIEVWLDVVYNHTAECDQNGPTYSFRGIDNDSYYLLTPDLRHCVNDTGCGNTVRTGHPAGRVLVLESLRSGREPWGWMAFVSISPRRRVVDTARPSPQDIVEAASESSLDSAGYEVRARSVVVLRSTDRKTDWGERLY